MSKSGGTCSLDIENQDQEEENYCNSFSAEFLVPSVELRIDKLGRVDEKVVKQLTEIYGVSKQVIMLRLLEFGYIDRKRYEEFKTKMNKREDQDQRKVGRRNWDKVFLNRVGNMVLQEIRNSYNKQIITFYEASSILGLKTRYAEKFIIP